MIKKEMTEIEKIVLEQNTNELKKLIDEDFSFDNYLLIYCTLSVVFEENEISIKDEFIDILSLSENEKLNRNFLLLYAFYNELFALAKYLIYLKADINCEFNRETLLQVALMRNNIKLVKLFLDNGAKYKNDITSPIVQAIRNDNLEMVKLFIKYEKENGIFESNNVIYLGAAVDIGNIKILELLIQSGISMNYLYNQTTPLIKAVKIGNLQIIDLLIKNGADINFTATRGMTPLMWSVLDTKMLQNNFSIKYLNPIEKAEFVQSIKSKKVDISITKYLIENGAKLNLKNDAGMTAYNIAKYCKNIYAEKLLIENHANTDKFKINTFKKILETIILGEYNDIDKTLMSFKLTGRNVIDNRIKYLFSKKHFLDILNIFNFNKDEEINKVNKDEEINKRSLEDWMIYELENELEFSEIFSFSTFDTYNEIGLSVLLIEWIKDNRSKNIIKKLISKKININYQDIDGNTALFYAIKSKKLSIIKLLLENGADITIENKEGKDVLDLIENEQEIYDLILKSQKINNNFPQKLVKILTNFTTDKPMKYTTHIWDFGDLSQSEHKNFDGYMSAVKIQWDTIKDDLESLSPDLYKKVYNFLWETDSSVAIGWSSMDGLKEWCDASNENKPEDFKNFKDIIIEFKKEIEIRKDTMLEDIFIQERKKLGRKFKVELVKLKGQTFYTDTQKFTSVINTIFKQFTHDGREKYPNITVEIIGDSTDEFIELKITQLDVESGSSSNVMLEEIQNGEFAGIKENLTNLCDWSIESSFEDNSYRINYLKSNNKKDIEELDYKPKGFTHIMRFYNK